MRPETPSRLAPALSAIHITDPILPRPLWETLLTAPNSAPSLGEPRPATASWL